MPIDIKVSLSETEKLINLCNALNSNDKLQIFHAITKQSYNVYELAKMLDMSYASVLRNIKLLEKAGLIFTIEKTSQKKSVMRNCSVRANSIYIDIFDAYERVEEKDVDINFPIGSYFDFFVSEPCEIISSNGVIGNVDDALSFYLPDRVNAELISMSKGFLEYRIVNPSTFKDKPKKIEVILEICSEAPNSNLNWPSDITIWINDIEAVTFTSKSDFGGRRGQHTPEWWPLYDTQYGELKNITVVENGVYINGELVGSLNIKDLNLDKSKIIKLKIGIKDDAVNKGGMNLFGKKFGDFNQDIKIKIVY